MNQSENSSNSPTDIIESETDSKIEQIVEKIVKKMKFVEEKPNAEETIKPKKTTKC